MFARTISIGENRDVKLCQAKMDGGEEKKKSRVCNPSRRDEYVITH